MHFWCISVCSDAIPLCVDCYETSECYECEGAYEVNSDNTCSLPCKSVYVRAKSYRIIEITQLLNLFGIVYDCI